MIKLDIATRNYEADAKVKDYLQDKIGALDKFLPRHVRGVTHGQAMLEEDPNGREDNRFVCEVVLTVAGTTMVCREGTLNMYAAIDIVVAKIKAQMRTYKDKHVAKSRRPRLLSRFLRREAAAAEQASAAEPTA
jgi:ribosomal subunit interface protein